MSVASTRHLGPRLSTAEGLAVCVVGWLALAVLLSYAFDLCRIGLAPAATVAGATVGTLTFAIRMWPRTVFRPGDAALFVATVSSALAALLWATWPALLPPGSGPDLTHHLQLIDYLQRHGTLVHDPAAGAFLGEMADYTPGLHILAVIAGWLWRADAFQALYPVVAFTVALKLGLFALIVCRVLDDDRVRVPAAVLAVLCVIYTASYSAGSFLQDSFLAQVVSELFAVFAWWALLWWDQSPSRPPLALFALGASAVFLTWPVWLGPLLVSVVAVIALRSELNRVEQFRSLLLAAVPVAVVAIVHAAGRTSWVSILGTSGAVTQPSPSVLGVWLPFLAAVGFVCAAMERRSRVVVALLVALAVQAVALWIIARARGAATPYMAIKMIYLAIYPAIAAAVLAIAWLGSAIEGRARSARWRGALAIVGVWVLVIGVASMTMRRERWARLTPVVSHDLFAAGQWARAHVPPDCVDYLVGNEYTAYWLHLAVLGNARASARTGDDTTFATQASFARWLVPGTPRYAIANLAVLPAEIRESVDVLTQTGQAVVIGRRGDATCPPSDRPK